MKIDKIYVINLETRIDRKEEMLEELKKMKINDLGEVEFFNGIIPTEEILNTWNSNYINPLPQFVINSNIDEKKYRLGCLGCLLSHFTIIQKAYSLNYENIIIFEDDALFEENDKSLEEILKIYNIFFDKIVKEFGIFYLGGNHKSINLKHIIDNLYLTDGTLCTHSYIINREGMKFVIDNLTGYSKEIDVFYRECLQKNKFCYTIHPPLFSQRKSFSNILNNEIKYNLNTLK